MNKADLEFEAELRTRKPPPRFRRPKLATIVLLLILGGFLAHAWEQGARVDLATIVEGSGGLVEFIGQTLPPSTERLGPILVSLLVTFEMALVGTILGVLLSLPIGIFAAKNTTPHAILYGFARSLIGLFRTIPDLVWGIIFVVAVGLGPKAGVLAITVDTMGFCGRFFGESIEEIEPGTLEGLRATGATEASVLAGAVLPSRIPSFIAIAMFALEWSVRSSVVLGIVGAGGIGVELVTSMQLLRYDEALMIMISIFVVVIVVERLSSTLRQRIL